MGRVTPDNGAKVVPEASEPPTKRQKIELGEPRHPTADSPGWGSQRTSIRPQLHTAGPRNASPSSERGLRRSRRRLQAFATKRASALNLRNYPSDPHPVGMAIWVIQKIEQARRLDAGSLSGDESSRDASKPSSPGTVPVVWSEPALGPQQGCVSNPAGATTPKSSSLVEVHPLWDQGSSHQHEESNTRLQAQRDRKTKQRSENWAKSRYLSTSTMTNRLTEELSFRQRKRCRSSRETGSEEEVWGGGTIRSRKAGVHAHTDQG